MVKANKLGKMISIVLDQLDIFSYGGHTKYLGEGTMCPREEGSYPFRPGREVIRRNETKKGFQACHSHSLDKAQDLSNENLKITFFY